MDIIVVFAWYLQLIEKISMFMKMGLFINFIVVFAW